MSFAIARSWCPDRTMAQARKYIAESMGSNYAENVILDLEKTWEESDNKTPLINFLSMGSDPTSLIENLAKRHKFGKNVVIAAVFTFCMNFSVPFWLTFFVFFLFIIVCLFIFNCRLPGYFHGPRAGDSC